MVCPIKVVGVFATSLLGNDIRSIAADGDENGEDGEQEDTDAVGGGEERDGVAVTAVAGNTTWPTSIADTALGPTDAIAAGFCS